MSWNNIPDWSVTIAQTLLNTLRYKDPFTFFHCVRVGRASRRLAQAVGLNEYEQAVLEYSGLFHDIGKVGIADNILLKPARLEKNEYEIMKTHAQLSEEIILPMAFEAFFKEMLPGVRSHHERPDGKGYPDNLKGDEIPMSARIIAVVDTVDAMMNTRPYRESLPFDLVKKELVDFSGTQFDGDIVKVYLDAVRFWKDIKEEDQEEKVISSIIKKAG